MGGENPAENKGIPPPTVHQQPENAVPGASSAVQQPPARRARRLPYTDTASKIRRLPYTPTAKHVRYGHNHTLPASIIGTAFNAYQPPVPRVWYMTYTSTQHVCSVRSLSHSNCEHVAYVASIMLQTEKTWSMMLTVHYLQTCTVRHLRCTDHQLAEYGD